MAEVEKEDELILKNHVTNVDKNIYAIFNLPPEVVAVLFAYYSRSPNTFRKNLLKLIKDKELDVGELTKAYRQKEGLDYSKAKEKAMEFHRKWVVGYGHGSVAEHANASVSMEEVSILATKVIEDCRLAAFTEKSTRYQVFDRDSYYKPKKLLASEFKGLYEETCNHLMDTYTELYPQMLDWVKKNYPKPEAMAEKLYESKAHAKACDIVRYLLPASTLTNLGMTVNARELAHAIRKWLSHPLEELQEVGEQTKQEVKKLVPSLLDHAEFNEYISETDKRLDEVARQAYKKASGEEPNGVKLVAYDKDAVEKVAAALLYAHSRQPYAEVLQDCKEAFEMHIEALFKEALEKMGRHDAPLRELEHANYTFDIVVDYGAFRDIQRHRICTQTNQDLGVELGFETPEELVKAGFEKEFKDCMEKAREAYHRIKARYPKEAQYVVPLAYRKRVLLTCNFRELFHFIKLRSGPQGHLSYRKIAVQCFEEIEKVHPLFARYIKVNKSLEEGWH